ncbi:MAG: SAM-dependent methyltransferase [Burkholderiales bacterium]
MTENAELKRWNTRFSIDSYLFGKAPNAFLAAQKGRLKAGGKALSIADGEGRNGVWLAEQGLQVTAFDFSPVGAQKARKLATERGVAEKYQTQVAELSAWDWDATQFDIIAAIFIQFATPPERAHMFAGICRALKPGGVLLLQGYRPEQIAYATGGPRVPEQMYTASLLKDAFAALEILELREHDSEVDEGEGHGGMSALLDLMARRPA